MHSNSTQRGVGSRTVGQPHQRCVTEHKVFGEEWDSLTLKIDGIELKAKFTIWTLWTPKRQVLETGSWDPYEGNLADSPTPRFGQL